MDTQRLILWLIFSFSAVMLWQAWERERNPPPITTAAPAAPGQPAGAQPQPSAPAPGVPAAAPVAGAPPAATTPVASQTIEVRTDLFVADIDTVGGVVSRVALDKHRDAQDSSKPYLALQRNAERTFVAQAGMIGDGMPNPSAAISSVRSSSTASSRPAKKAFSVAVGVACSRRNLRH